jgi:hypothetical protein
MQAIFKPVRSNNLVVKVVSFRMEMKETAFCFGALCQSLCQLACGVAVWCDE